jgi:hypothetical protein
VTDSGDKKRDIFVLSEDEEKSLFSIKFISSTAQGLSSPELFIGERFQQNPTKSVKKTEKILKEVRK